MRHRTIPFRYVWPAELDLMARIAGLRLRDRWGDWRGGPFTAESRSHVSVGEACLMPARSPEEIHALLAAAVNAGDVDAFAELHEPEATLIVARPTVAASAVETKRSGPPRGPSSPSAPPPRSSSSDKLQSGDLALTFARVEVLGSVTRGTVVSRRQADGTWRIVLDNPMSP